MIYYTPGYIAGYNTYVSEITTQPLPESGVYTILAGDNAGDNTGIVQRSEAIQAVMDYFSGIITKQDAIQVVMAYFNG